MRLFITTITCMMLSTNCTFAKDYSVPESGKVTAIISDKGVNRIAVEGDRISEVVGNDDEYTIDSDGNLGQVFLTSTRKSPYDISVRLITEHEKVIDAKLTVKEVEPQTVILKPTRSQAISSQIQPKEVILTNSASNVPVRGAVSNNFADLRKQEIIDSIRNTRDGKLKGIELKTLSCLNNFSYLSHGLVNQYQAGADLIIKANIKNKSSESITLSEPMFSKCMHRVIAVAFDKDRLANKESTTLYLVGRDGE